MARSETGILRNEIARMAGEMSALRAENAQAVRRIAEEVRARIRAEAEAAGLRAELADAEGRAAGLARDIEELRSGRDCGCRTEMEGKDALIARLRGMLKFHDNANTPPSKSVRRRKTRADRARAKAQKAAVPAPNRGGRPRGHPGVSHSQTPDRTEVCRSDRCGWCGSTGIVETGSRTKMLRDLKSDPEIETVLLLLKEYTCTCGHVTVSGAGVPGTQFGKRLLSLIVCLYSNYCSLSSIADVLGELGVPACRRTVQSAIEAFADRAHEKGVIDGIRRDVAASEYVGYDETPHPMCGGRGYVWGCVSRDATIIQAAPSRDATIIQAAPSRASAVILEYFPWTGKPATVDGYRGYGVLDTIQRCWAHILRESRFEASPRPGYEPGPELAALHGELHSVFVDACHISQSPGAAGCRAAMEARCRAVVEGYCDDGCGFGTTLGNALPDLFTFLDYPGMSPTNNAAELAMRAVVRSRNTRLHIASKKGMRTFSTVMTCVLTWKKRGLRLRDEVARLY